MLQYTSGTTGEPKGAMLTHANLQANAAQGRAWVPGLKDGRETVYAVLPMFHAYGLTLCMTFALSIGARLVLFPKFDVDLVLKAYRKSPATFLPAAPPIYDRIAAAAARQGISLAGIRYSISGAMNLPAATVETWGEGDRRLPDRRLRADRDLPHLGGQSLRVPAGNRAPWASRSR